ncbi:MAG: hypothetical protein A3A33_04095 [Candidatus Yanofskybacteria bacterium RIFCSPLOWO2_01_FULL_49_25]|uniref:HD domain-containing protein n=1 Tax=Candidatus Yanofskybacteria bacterium RIFCSPLOWO2_01_FULL_49_25 TaxID=1802701 RepID=A0A1F8GS37_9BACT|nr:MAG: hypothetical protein A3A33_04095 [Candidatus Yanofskybacteria bacterium RIFCSPLOWO2_01_FULL_49_25]
MSNLIQKSRDLMKRQTKKNGAPAWALTELAVRKGKELAKRCGVDEELVVVSPYLAHVVFSKKPKNDIQRHHPKLSSKFARTYLQRWKIDASRQEIICNAIEAHHGHVPIKSREAEVMKNAECFKFLTLEGIILFFHDLGMRGMNIDEAVDYIRYKVRQKFGYLTLSVCKQEARKNKKQIDTLLATLAN